MMIPPSGEGEMKLSCFSAVMPVSGWNQCVKCVAPFDTAQSFIAAATALATPISSDAPSSMVFFKDAYTSADSIDFITLSPNTKLPKVSGTVFIVDSSPFCCKKAKGASHA